MSAAVAGFGVCLAALLVALARIDWRKMILPDWLNALLALTGLAQSLALRDPEPWDALAGALVAGGLMFAVAAFYRRTRGVDGLGFGDVKLAAAGAIWTGLAGIGPMLLVASASAGASIAARAWSDGRLDAGARHPFGPWLALGVFSAWLMTHLWR